MNGRLIRMVFVLSVSGFTSGVALEVGFGEVDITPKLGGEEKVWLAGYSPGRQAAGMHDPLMARCVVLKDGEDKLAFVSVGGALAGSNSGRALSGIGLRKVSRTCGRGS